MMYSINTCIFCGQTSCIESEKFDPIDQRERVESVRSSVGTGSGSSSSPAELESICRFSSGNIYHPVQIGMPENTLRSMELLFNKIKLTNKSEFNIDDLLALECVSKHLRKISSKAWNVLLLLQNSLNNVKISDSIKKLRTESSWYETMRVDMIRAGTKDCHMSKNACLQIKKLNMPLCTNDQLVLEAVNKNYPELLELLLDSGANVEAQNADGLTILMLAAKLGHTECMRVIMRAGADLDKTICTGTVRGGDFRQVSAFFFVENRQDVGLQLIWEMRSRGILETCNAITELLDIPVGLEINEQTTPLMYAAGAGNKRFVDALINAGAHVNAMDPESEQTALMWAAYKGHADVVWTLLSAGANRDMISMCGSTALLQAKSAKSDIENVLAFLIKDMKDSNSDYYFKCSEQLINYDRIIWMLSSEFFRVR